MPRNLGRLRYARRRFSLFQGVACDMNDSYENVRQAFSSLSRASWVRPLPETSTSWKLVGHARRDFHYLPVLHSCRRNRNRKMQERKIWID